MISTALIGVSGFGGVHYADLLRCRERGEARIVGATVINQDEEQEKCAALVEMGCGLYDDYRVMLKELSGTIDLCCIPTGIGLHAPMAIEAMKHGAHCLIEKPAAPCIQDVHAMREMAQSTGKFVAVGYQSIYQPEFQQIKRDVVAGCIGPLRCVKGVGLWPRDSHYYSRNNWAGRIKNEDGWVLDSPFNNALAHYVNLLCFFAGPTFERSATLAGVRASLFRANPTIENADSAVMHLDTADGVDVLFYTSHCCQESYGPVIKLCGEKGSIEWTTSEAVYRYADGSSESRSFDFDMSAMRDNVMGTVVRRVSDPSQFICGLDIAERQVLACNGLHESSPIIPIDSAWVDRMETDEGYHRFVCRGIEGVFKELCAKESFSTPEYPWMKLGDRFSLAGYREFSGGLTGVS